MGLFKLGGIIPDENRRELMFLRENLGVEGYLRHAWTKRNDGLGEDRYPSSHKEGWPYKKKISPPSNLTKLEIKNR
jgi:hypothetical protein